MSSAADDLEHERDPHEPRGEERAPEAREPAGAGELREQPAAHRQQDHEQAREARLGGGGADLVLEPGLLLHRAGALAQEPGEVAAGAALEQAGRHEHVEPRRADPLPQRRERGLGGGAGVELPGGPAERVAGRAVDRARGLADRPAQRVPARHRVGERERDLGNPRVDRPRVAQAPRAQHPRDRPRARAGERQAEPRPRHGGARHERHEGAGGEEAAPLHRSRDRAPHARASRPPRPGRPRLEPGAARPRAGRLPRPPPA